VSAVRSQAGGPRDAGDVSAELPGLSRSRLAWRQATYRRGWAIALWVSLAAAVALPALLLLIDAMAVESGLAETLAADGGLSVRQDVPSVDAFNALGRQVDARVSARTGAALIPLGATATAGPLHLVTIRSEPAAPQQTQRTLTAVYAAHLADHVTVVAGELPAEGLGGGETAVAMPQAGADQLGLRLSDRVCADFVAGADAQARWCARIVGLWQPVAADDPFWGGQAPRLELTMGRFDLFEMAKLRPPQGPVATVRYWAAPAAISPDDVAALAGQVTALSADVRTPQRRVDSRLDRSLLAFDARQRAATAAIHALAVLVTVLGLGSVGLVAGRFLVAQARELALLRARGWPRRRAWRVAFLGMGAVGLTAAAAALAACALAAVTLSVTSPSLTALAIRRSDLPGLLLALGPIAAALVGLLALLAARAVWPDPAPSLRGARERRWTGGRVAGVAAGAVGAALMVVAPLSHFFGSLASAHGAGRELLLIAPALGAVMVAAGAVSLAPAAAWVPGRGSIPGALAGLQLQRRPRQHAGAVFVLMVATAGAVFAALATTVGQASDQPALRLGVSVAMAAGAGGGLLLALAAFGLHFNCAAQRRLREYGGLFAHGLPPAQVSRSLGAEQAATAGAGLVGGGILGAALALALLPTPPAAGALAALTAAAALTGGAALIASLSRRLPARVDAQRLQRQEEDA
jgi:hypothetical protein